MLYVSRRCDDPGTVNLYSALSLPQYVDQCHELDLPVVLSAETYDEHLQHPASHVDLRCHRTATIRAAELGHVAAIREAIACDLMYPVPMPNALPPLDHPLYEPCIVTVDANKHALCFRHKTAPTFRLSENERVRIGMCTEGSCGFVHTKGTPTSHNMWLEQCRHPRRSEERVLQTYVEFAKTVADGRADVQLLRRLLRTAPCVQGSVIRCALHLYYTNVVGMPIPADVQKLMQEQTFRRGWKRHGFLEVLGRFLDLD